VNTALAAVSFTPAADNEVNTTITTHIEDQDGASPLNGSIALNVTPSNDPPTATNLVQVKAYNEGDATVALDDIVVSDIDLNPAQTITATLTLANTAAGSLTAASGNGEIYTAGTGIWTVTGTLASVNAALAAVAFTPATDNDVNTTISTHIEDQDGASPVDGSIALNVTPANDPPTATNLTQVKAYNEGDLTVALDDIVVSELDVNPAQAITATLTLANTAAGALSATSGNGESYAAGTGIWTVTGTLASVNAALAGVAFTPATDNEVDTTITTHIEDQDAAGPADGSIALNVTPVNDAPTATNLTQAKLYNEGDGSVALDDIVVSDIDLNPAQTITATLTLANTAAGSLTAASGNGESYAAGTGIWTVTGTLVSVNAALASVAFSPATDNDVNTTITTHVEDQDGASPADGSVTLNVIPANDPPTATNLTQVKAYNEGDGTVALDDIVVSELDVNPAQAITATLTLANTAAGSLTDASGNGESYTAGTGIWTVTGTLASVNAALAAVAFSPATDNDVDTTITTHIEDQNATGPVDGSIALNVTPSNDPPTATNLNQIKAYNEGDGSVALDDIVVSEIDVNPAQTITATLTLANTAAGSLTAASGNGESYTAGTGIWTVTGTLASVNAALASVAFSPATDNDVDTTITTHVEDQDGASPVDGSIALNVTPANDPPTATNLNQVKAYNEDDPTVALDDIVVSEIDVNPVQAITATLTLANTAAGSLTAGSGNGETYTAGTGIWTVTGTLASVNAALAAVAFAPAADNDLNTTITTHIEDQDAAGPADGSIALNVTPSSDAPTATNNTVTAIEDIAYVFSAAEFNFADVDTGDTLQSVRIETLPALGTINLAGFGPVITGQVITVADIAANNLSFTTDSDGNGIGYTSFTFTVNDGSLGSSPANTMTVDVTPANDPSTATNLTQVKAYTEGDPTVAFDDIVVSDIDVNPAQVITATLTLADTATGSLSAASGNGETYTAGTGVWTVSGTLASVNAALAAVSFTPATENDANTTVTTHIEDQDGAGPVDGLISLNVTPVNDPPTATNLIQVKVYNEGDPTVALDDIVVSDIDVNPAQTITATLTLATPAAGVLTAGSGNGEIYTAGTGVWTVTGTLASVNAALAAVAFTPATDNDVNTTITTHIEDQSAAGPADGSITLNVTPANDAPTATNLTQAKAYNEGDGSVALDDIVVSDVDTNPAQVITATLTLANTAAGSLTASSGNGETYTAGTGVWTVTGTVANVNAALVAVAFTPATDNDVNTTITTHIQDQNSAAPADGLITLNVTPANDPPTATNLNQVKAYNEGDLTVALDDIVVSEIDVNPAQAITATLTLINPAAGVLTAGSGNGETYTAGTGVWTVTGTLASVNTALAAVSFTPATNNDVNTIITTHIEDQDAAGPANGLISLNVTPSNDAPTATNLIQVKAYNEGDATVALDDIVVSEVDTNPGQTITATLTLANTAAGVLTAANWRIPRRVC